MAIRLNSLSKAGPRDAMGLILVIAEFQLAKKFLLRVIPNEVRNLSVLESEKQRDSSARSVPRNDKVVRVLTSCLLMALILFAPLPASRAQDSSKASEADSTAIKQTFTDFYESFSRHDAHATAMT